MVTRSAAAALYFPVVGGCLLAAVIAGVAIGSTHLDWETVIRILSSRLLPDGWVDDSATTEAQQVIVWMIRMPRVLVAGMAGAALAVAGTQMQGMFRNPLAEPNIIGVSAGAALGAVVSFVTGLAAASALWLPFCAFVGALGALATVYSITMRAGRTPVATLLLAGIALSALLSAVTTLLVSLSFVDWQVAAEIVFWLMGGLDSRTWTHVWICLPFVTLGTLSAVWLTRDLDLMLLGEETSASLGVNVETLKRLVLLTSALLTGAAVAVSGVVGFVGLVVPHAIRLVLGPSHRVLVPASVLGGALFMILCDLIARTVHPPTEIRLGVVTAAFGAPFFLYLLRKRSKEIGYF